MTARCASRGDYFFQLYSDWAVSQYLSRITFPFTIEAAQHFVAHAQAALRQGSTYTLGIFERGSEAFVGVISLRVPSRDPTYPEEWRAEDVGLGILGYSVVPAYWHHGFATESAARMITFAFDDLALTRLQASPLRDNPASARILQRLNFTMTEVGIEEKPLYGGPVRLADCYMLVRPDITE